MGGERYLPNIDAQRSVTESAEHLIVAAGRILTTYSSRIPAWQLRSDGVPLFVFYRFDHDQSLIGKQLKS